MKHPKIKFHLRKHGFSGETVGTNCDIFLYPICTQRELIDTIAHEAFHAVLNIIGETSTKQDHYILKRLQTEWF